MGKQHTADLGIMGIQLMGKVSELLDDVRSAELDHVDALNDAGAMLVRYVAGEAGVSLLCDRPTARDCLAFVLGSLIQQHRYGFLSTDLVSNFDDKVAKLRKLLDSELDGC